MSEFFIKDRKISRTSPTYFIADVAANHNGDLNKAIELIHMVAEAGGHAAKFQNFQARRIVSKRGFEDMQGKLSHQANWKKSVFEVYEDASIDRDWTQNLKEACDKYKIDYFTSPYDYDSVDLVDPYVDVYKIGSGDITWPEIIDYIAKKNKPMMIATGASDITDVQRAMSILEQTTEKIVLMQCNTNYTASPNNFNHINLNVLRTFATMYPTTVLGLSDHTPGHSTVLGAVALGARVVEKHFTDDNNRDGPDHKFSMNPESWREMVDRTRELEAALGDGVKVIEENEKSSIMVQRRALRFKKDIARGTVLTEDHIESLRPIPEDGLAPYHLNSVIGKNFLLMLKKEHMSNGRV
jgi:N-acetylneuraminate synthase